MIDYEKTVQKIIDSITNFSFEYDFEALKKEMELQEVSQAELEKLGENKVQENFNNGVFKIKMPNGNLIDSNTIYKHSIENNIEKPVLYINPDFKYVQCIVKKDFVKPQIKKQIKNQLTNNTDIDFTEVQKALLIEDVKNKEIVGYINEVPIKTSNYIKEGKFYVNSSCTKEDAHNLIHEVIKELKSEKIYYVNEKLKRDRLIACAYLIFMLIVIIWWCFNNQNLKMQKWLSISVGLFLFVAPFITSFINHSFIDSILFIQKAKKKYEKEFNN